MAMGLTSNAKHRGCRLDLSYPFAGERPVEGPIDGPRATPEHPLRVSADVRRA